MFDEITHDFSLKTFCLKYLVGERYKGWISQSPLLVHSSVGKHLVLAYMPRNPEGGRLLYSTTRLNLPI